jgi:hypothetical protein
MNKQDVIYLLSSLNLKLQSEGLHILYSSPSTIRQIKSKMRWAGNVACMGEERKGRFFFLWGRPKERDLLKSGSGPSSDFQAKILGVDVDGNCAQVACAASKDAPTRIIFFYNHICNSLHDQTIMFIFSAFTFILFYSHYLCSVMRGVHLVSHCGKFFLFASSGLRSSNRDIAWHFESKVCLPMC